jgi:hypothetical protein
MRPAASRPLYGISVSCAERCAGTDFRISGRAIILASMGIPYRELAGPVGSRILLLLLPLFLAILPRPATAQTELPALSEAEAPALPLPVPWTGDFDKMKQRRLVRFLVPFSKTIYFLDKGAERGTAAEFGQQFGVCINKKYKTKALKIIIAFVPVARGGLLSDLN